MSGTRWIGAGPTLPYPRLELRPDGVRRPGSGLACGLLAFVLAACAGPTGATPAQSTLPPASPTASRMMPPGTPLISPVASSSPSATASAAPSATAAPPPPTRTPSGSHFVLTGAMKTLRDDNAATLLQNGRVLITGGYTCGTVGPCPIIASAELYDPATGKFSLTGSMAQVRQGHTATLLNDGRVLVAGGWEGVYRVASAELYDPATGKFGSTGSMAAARERHSGTLLDDGRVLVAGGWGGSGALASAELYDPATGTFSPTGSMQECAGRNVAVLLGDGRVLVACTEMPSGKPYASVELYDPAVGEFTVAATSDLIEAYGSATLLEDGRVLLIGGPYPGGDVSAAEIYDPVTGTLSQTTSMSADRPDHSATLLADGRVLVAGGGVPWVCTMVACQSAAYASTEYYVPATGKFVPGPTMNVKRATHTATRLPDGRVLITGGFGAFAAGPPASELYIP
jgi:hypothetical protein